MTQCVQCLQCRHYLGAMLCDAFLDGIPPAIATGEHVHREPYPGDKGIRFEMSERGPIIPSARRSPAR